jgi:hypothetical protein
MRLAILILHGLGDPLAWRAAVRDVELLLPDHAPEHAYVVHGVEQPIPAFIKQTRFHAIVLGPTFLCARYTPHALARVRAQYEFVADSDAFKIALPQDDYDCSARLDRWMIDWHIDSLYAACADHWDVLYPQFSATGRIRQGYTGYIADSWLRRFRDPKPHSVRNIDVSYRARQLPPNFGRLGWIKGHIGERFATHPATASLKLDISTQDADLVPGSRWHDFIEDSKFCLATNTGSSLIDPEGLIRACVEGHLINDPGATFEQIEDRCFKGQDGRYTFTAISPRNIEAALARTVQIATPGRYSGILNADAHYIPIEPNCSNAADVVQQMKDAGRVARSVGDAREAVLAVPELRAANHARRLIRQIQDGVGAKRIQGASPDQMAVITRRYEAEVSSRADAFWAAKRRRQKIRDVAVALGARKIKRWLMRTG